MSKKNQYRSVPQMVQGLSEDRAFADEFAKRLSGRQLIKALTVLRTSVGLSQQDLAAKLGCTQSKVSKMERSADAELRFGDLLAYAGAVGYEMRLFLVPEGQPLVGQVKMHAFAIKRLLDRLVTLAENDTAVTKGVTGFLEEAAFNLVRIVAKAAVALPPIPKGPALPIQVEALGVKHEDGPSPETALGGEEERCLSDRQ
jgi:transcriptional regulator with XRE-family HTH domain